MMAGPDPEQQSVPQEQAAVERHANPQPVAPEQRAAAEKLRRPVLETNSIGMKLVLIPAGEFMMSSTESVVETGKAYEGAPAPWFKSRYVQHKVRITRPLYVGVYEVTQEQYEAA